MTPENFSIEINPDVRIELVEIPAGEFTLGATQRISLGAFAIGKYPVTNEQYSEFIQESGRPSPDLWVGRLTPPQSILRHPVVGVSWQDAVAFAEWLAGLCGKQIHLPNEAQWERAARGDDGRLYPWGNAWLDVELPAPPKVYIGDDTWIPVRTAAVGSASPQTDSPFGCADLCRNVLEWCSSAAEDHPYDPGDGREDLQSTGVSRVLRGASLDDPAHPDAAVRHFAAPHEARETFGFRIARGRNI